MLALLVLALLAAPWAMAERDQDLLSVRQAAELLGLSPETLYGYRYRSYLRPPGFPTGFKVGGRVKWQRRDLLAWIEQQRSGQANGQHQP